MRALERFGSMVDRARGGASTASRARLGIDTVTAVVDRFNPVFGGPAAPLKTEALFGAFGPSLMPRASVHQGMAAGLSVLAAEVVGRAVDAGIRRLVPSSASLTARVVARTAVTAAGLAIGRIPAHDDESTAVASLRTAGRLTAAGAAGGAIHETGVELRSRVPSHSGARPIITGLASFAGAMVYARRLLVQRQQVVQKWTADDKAASLGPAIGIGFAVATVGRGIGHAFARSRGASVRFFGDDPVRATIGRGVNAGAWAAAGAALYTAGVGSIARANEKIEPAYATPPSSPYVSGGPNSISPFEELGQQGRRFVTDVVTPDLIESTLGDPAVAHPIRAFVGVNSEPLYPSARSEMMLDELERLGAFDRSHLLLVSPTGTGWVDQTMIESAELLTRGDIATACIQYGRGPSFLEVQKVHLGRSQFRGLLWGVKLRLHGLPPDQRPKVLVFGESLGAWSSSDVVMHQGIAGFDHYGIDRALWFGLPGLAKWSKTGMRQGSGALVPPGTVRAFDHFAQYASLSEDERERLRAVVVDHDNDPIAQMAVRWAVKRPPWLDGDERGRNVPEGMHWMALVTFVQVLVDAMNAMRVVPGEFRSFGHDYRADTADFVRAAYRLPPVTQEQMDRTIDTLRRLEVERGERIKRANTESPELGRRIKRPGRWRRAHDGVDADESAVRRTTGQAPADIQ
jgi:uncharacterized membrane protein